MVTFVFSFCLRLFGFCVFCVCGSVDILVVKAKHVFCVTYWWQQWGGKSGQILLLYVFFSTFGFHFLRGVAWVVEKEMEEIYVWYVCLHSTFYAHLWLYFFLSFCFYKFCQFAPFTFSSLMTSSTLGTHTHSHIHKLMKETKEKMAAHAKNIHTLEVVCVCPFFFCTCTGPFFYENFWRDLILAPSQFLLRFYAASQGQANSDCEYSTSFVSSRALFTCRTRWMQTTNHNGNVK